MNRHAAQLHERNVAQINGKQSVGRDEGEGRHTDARMKLCRSTCFLFRVFLSINRLHWIKCPRKRAT